jgi:hypothetical protein
MPPAYWTILSSIPFQLYDKNVGAKTALPLADRRCRAPKSVITASFGSAVVSESVSCSVAAFLLLPPRGLPLERFG